MHRPSLHFFKADQTARGIGDTTVEMRIQTSFSPVGILRSNIVGTWHLTEAQRRW